MRRLVLEGRPFVLDHLLLKERVQHDRGSSGVLQLAHRVEVVDQRRRAGHQGMGEFKTEVGGLEVHGEVGSEFDSLATGCGPEPLPTGGGVVTSKAASCW